MLPRCWRLVGILCAFIVDWVMPAKPYVDFAAGGVPPYATISDIPTTLTEPTDTCATPPGTPFSNEFRPS